MNTKNIDVKNARTMALRYEFKPKEDITAFELAQLFPYILGGKTIFKADLEKLEERELLRHLKIK